MKILNLIKPSKRITSDITLEGHTLLTGPNRGGKSSSLRAILQQVLLGQVFGFTKDAIGSWNPFYSVLTRLKSRDTAGKESLFEMEVRNASKMIHSMKKSSRNSLILIDELFHSTNPPDAEISARIFLEQLWKLPSVKSIISTHIFTLCENPPSNIKTLCCPAVINSNNSISYSYTLREGICTVSSVNEVLRESGLLRA
jgi:DNA mismatch repair protein MSH3